jgi:hypothetical protein
MDGARATVEVVHVTPGRVRLRVRDRAGGLELFERLGRATGSHATVREVRVNVQTGSLLVWHTGALEPLLAHLGEIATVQVVQTHSSGSTMQRLRVALDATDARLTRATQGGLSFEALTFYGALLSGAYQLVRGKFLPAGMTLFSYAIDALEREARRADEQQRQGGAERAAAPPSSS